MGKHKTYRGIDLKHYRKMRDSMDDEAFGKWVHTVTGKPRSRGPHKAVPDTKASIDWETLAKKLQKALAAEMKKNEELQWGVNVYRQTLDSQLETIEKLENRSWFSRIFNLKG